MASKFGYTTKTGKYFGNPQIGKRAEQDEDERTKGLKPLGMEDDSDNGDTGEGIEVHIKHIGPHGTMTKDGNDHEYENLHDMHDKLNKFLGEEEDEWKNSPDEEEENHKDSMGDDEESSRGFNPKDLMK